MSATRIANRYAKSLIDMAKEQGALDQVLGDMRTFHGALEHRAFLLLTKSPIIHADKKLAIFKDIFDGKISSLTLSFFNIIIKKGRETFLPEITTAYIDQYREMKNITTASVTTAAPLDEGQLAKIKSEIIHLGLASGDVELQTQVDPDVIGGFVLEVDDKLYDASIRKKLGDVKKEILDKTYIKSL